MDMNAGATTDEGRSRDDLPLRLATAAVGIPLLALCVWLGGAPFLAITAVGAFMGIWELRILLRPLGRVVWPVSALIAAAFLYTGYTSDTSPALVALTVIAGGSFGALLFTYRVGSWDGARSWIATIAAAVYPAALLSAGIALRESSDGLLWLSYAVIVTFASDTSAYAIGRLVGRHTLAPSISPGKTWEGTIGGIVGATAVSTIFALTMDLDALTLTTALLLGAQLSIVGQIGDLGESWLKRRTGVKDSGRLLPGHGGVLDRLDSLIPVVAVVFVYATVATTME